MFVLRTGPWSGQAYLNNLARIVLPVWRAVWGKSHNRTYPVLWNRSAASWKQSSFGIVWRTWRISTSLLWCHASCQPKDCKPYHSLFCPQCQNLTLQEIHALFCSPLLCLVQKRLFRFPLDSSSSDSTQVLGSLITAQIKSFASCCSSIRQYIIHGFIIDSNVIIGTVRFV